MPHRKTLSLFSHGNKVESMTLPFNNLKDFTRFQASRWTSPMVGAWLNVLGLDCYLDGFLENGVDGLALLSLRPSEIIRGVGIEDPNHALSFRMGVRLLKKQDLSTGSTSLRFNSLKRGITSIGVVGQTIEHKLNAFVTGKRIGFFRKEIDYSDWEWSCKNVGIWLHKRGLGVLAGIFEEAAVHGGVLLHFNKKKLLLFLSNLKATARDGISIFPISPLIFLTLWLSIKKVQTSERKTSALYPSSSILDWGRPQVNLWLQDINLGHLSPLFKKHCINGTSLVELKVEHLLDAMKLSELQAAVILRQIKILKNLVKENKTAQLSAADIAVGTNFEELKQSNPVKGNRQQRDEDSVFEDEAVPVSPASSISDLEQE
eukprot:snap_masked-scaffold_1-processed-gene-18.30-mRNA-1 protein AED:1.00 eAED:1.00 QI:0/-1/0/0/-1/1/1/0/373